MPPGADRPGRDPADIRHTTRQAVTDAGPAGAGLLYDARRGAYYANQPTPRPRSIGCQDRTPRQAPHRGRGRRLILISVRSALGHPAGRADWRGSGRRDRMALPGLRRRLRMGTGSHGRRPQIQGKLGEEPSPSRSATPSARRRPGARPRRRGQSRAGAGRCLQRCRSPGGGQPRTWRIHRSAARLGQPALRPSRALPRCRDPRPRTRLTTAGDSGTGHRPDGSASRGHRPPIPGLGAGWPGLEGDDRHDVRTWS